MNDNKKDNKGLIIKNKYSLVTAQAQSTNRTQDRED
jgi:hypothetical protein